MSTLLTGGGVGGVLTGGGVGGVLTGGGVGVGGGLEDLLHVGTVLQLLRRLPDGRPLARVVEERPLVTRPHHTPDRQDDAETA